MLHKRLFNAFKNSGAFVVTGLDHFNNPIWYAYGPKGKVEWYKNSDPRETVSFTTKRNPDTDFMSGFNDDSYHHTIKASIRAIGLD